MKVGLKVGSKAGSKANAKARSKAGSSRFQQLQGLLGRPVSGEDTLRAMGLQQLQAMTRELQDKLREPDAFVAGKLSHCRSGVAHGG